MRYSVVAEKSSNWCSAIRSGTSITISPYQSISYFDIAVHSIHVDIIIGKVGHVDIIIVTKIPIKM